jgi:hypothetical protein
MTLEKNNSLWELRNPKLSGNGKRFFDSPGNLWRAACSYFEWCDDNPYPRSELIKTGQKSGDIVDVPFCRPYSYFGLCVYLGCSLNSFETARRLAKKKRNRQLLEVFDAINNVIYANLFEGVAVGAFKANFMLKSMENAGKNAADFDNAAQKGIDINVITGTAMPPVSSENDIDI